MTPFSKNISITQIVKRWVWSQLCAFPNIKSPGNSQSSDLRCLYRRAREFYGLKAYTIRRAAEAMGVFPKKNVNYSDEPTLGRPYMKGWRKDSQSWASIRNPVWSEARAKWDEGFCDYGKSAPESFIKAQRDEFQKEVEENLKAWFGQNGPDAREFFYPRPELYSGGYSADAVLHVARNIFIKDFLWRVKIDDEDQSGEDRFDAYEIEQLYGSILNELETSSRTLSRESFRIELYRCGITSEKNGAIKRTHGWRPVLDVVDQIKLSLLPTIVKDFSEATFNAPQIWELSEVGEKDVKEKMLYDSAIAELYYEGFLKMSLKPKVIMDKSCLLDFYVFEPSSRFIDFRTLYLHTLNTERRSFQQQKPPLYSQFPGCVSCNEERSHERWSRELL